MPVDGNKRQVPKSIAGYGFKHLHREKIHNPTSFQDLSAAPQKEYNYLTG